MPEIFTQKKMDGEKQAFPSVAGSLLRPSWTSLLLFFSLLAVFSLQMTNQIHLPMWMISATNSMAAPAQTGIPAEKSSCVQVFQDFRTETDRTVMSIEEFGGVGDGETSNTEMFRRAIRYMESLGREKNGSHMQLIVPKGRWVTGSFNLTSNFTLFLEEGAHILGSLNPDEWPLIEPLPSYGRGRERLGGRHVSLLHGKGLSNVVITGWNGTIDGRGKMWWELWWNKTLNHTRGHLLELIDSQNILISNLTFINSPFWTIHPVFCRNVVVKDMTILAPLNAPNTDGIDPDSSINVCIEDCYIESGDDLVAVKSGWDQYGIATARPSSNIIIRRVSGTTPTCSGIGIGSEMSGGISNITIEDLHVWNSAAGIRIKSDKGRGGYISNIRVKNVTLERVKVPIRFSRGSNDHPDNGWDPTALPRVEGIFISNLLSLNSTKAPLLDGVNGSLFEGICFKNITLLGLSPSAAWHCEFLSGFSSDVFPEPCPQLQNANFASWCSEF